MGLLKRKKFNKVVISKEKKEEECRLKEINLEEKVPEGKFLKKIKNKIENMEKPIHRRI